MLNFEFDTQLKRFFGAEAGAGSMVTEKDEAKKRQITVTKEFEQDVLFSVYPDIPMGKVQTLGEAGLLAFRIYPHGARVKLPLIRRWDRASEIRLYMHAGVFHPRADDYWFLFRREGELWLGSVTQEELDAIRQGRHFDPQNGIEPEGEENYQDAINASAPIPPLVISQTTTYRRDQMVARAALAKSNYVCELLPDYPTFMSRSTGKPYLEAHHLVPIVQQRHFPTSLDVSQNICILNPFAHKMLHHATMAEIEPMIRKLAERRQQFLNGLGVEVNRLLECYGAA